MTVPLSVYPWPIPPERDVLMRAAKAALDLDFQIEPVEALPGGPGAVLAFGEVPPFVAEVVLIRGENVGNPESVKGAMAAALSPYSTPTFTEGDMLSMFLGVKVRELTDPFDLDNHEHAFELQRALR